MYALRTGRNYDMIRGGNHMTNKVITISRMFGSGGRTIGKAVAQRLGIPYYDKELVDAVAKESGFSH